MKTNQIMTRPMGCFSVEQRTKDAMFNATALLRQWNESTGERKEISKFFENANTKEFISALLEEENLNTQNSAYLNQEAGTAEHGCTRYCSVMFFKYLDSDGRGVYFKVAYNPTAGDGKKYFLYSMDDRLPDET